MASLTERIAVLIDADSSGAVRGFGEGGKSAKQFDADTQAAVRHVKYALAAVGVAATALAVVSVEKFRTIGAEVKGLARITGDTVEASSRLRFAAHDTGVEINTLATGIRTLEKHLTANDDAATHLGVAFRNASGQMRPFSEILDDVADRFASMPDGPEKTALALELFGRSGASLLPLLNKGSAGLAEMGDNAERLGLVLDTQAIGSIDAATKASRDWEASIDAVEVAIGQRALPVVTKLKQLAADGLGFVAAHRETATAAAGATLAASAFGTLGGVAANLNEIMTAGTTLLAKWKTRTAVVENTALAVSYDKVAASAGAAATAEIAAADAAGVNIGNAMGAAYLGKKRGLGSRALRGGLVGGTIALTGSAVAGQVGGSTGSVLNSAATGAAVGATVGSIIPGVGTVIGGVAGGALGAAAGAASRFGGTGTHVDAAKLATASTEDLNKAIETGTKLGGDFGNTIATMAQAELDARDASKEHASALVDATNAAAANRASLSHLNHELREYSGFALAANDSADAFRQSLHDLDAAAKENGKSLDRHTEKGLANRDAIRSSADAILAHAADMKEQGRSAQSVNKHLLDMAGRLRRNAIETYGNKDAVDELLKKWGLLPSKLHDDVSKFKAVGKTTGLSLGEGLVAGIRAKSGDVKAEASSLGTIAVRNLNRAAGVQSPSKHTMKTGQYLAEGLILGWKAHQPKVDAALRVDTRLGVGGGHGGSRHPGEHRARDDRRDSLLREIARNTKPRPHSGSRLGYE